jgi:hypothetical protein
MWAHNSPSPLQGVQIYDEFREGMNRMEDRIIQPEEKILVTGAAGRPVQELYGAICAAS